MISHGLLRGLLFIATLAIIGFVVQVSGLDFLINKAWIDSQIRGRGFIGEFLFIVVGAGCVAVGLPRQVISFLAGYTLGFTTGLFIALAATVGGCLITFSYARLLGRKAISKRFTKKIRSLDSFVSENPFAMTLLIRFLPAGSNLLTNLAAGVSGVAALPFIAGSAVGYIPQTAVFALVGSGIGVDPVWRISLSVILFMVCSGLGMYLYRVYRRDISLARKTIASKGQTGLEAETKAIADRQ